MKQQHDQQWGRRLKDCLLVSVLIIFISGCGLFTYQNPSPMPTQKWLADFFSNPTCDIPCWENIIPGKTTMEKAQLIVQSRDDIENFRGPIIPPPQPNYIDFTWSFKNDHRGGWIESDVNGEIVWFIELSLNLSLSQIIDKFGFPEQVFPRSTESNYFAELDLLYPKFNIRLMSGGAEKDGIIQITPQINISSIAMSTEDGQLLYLENFNDYQNRIWNWHGYGEYPVT